MGGEKELPPYTICLKIEQGPLGLLCNAVLLSSRPNKGTVSGNLWKSLAGGGGEIKVILL